MMVDICKIGAPASLTCASTRRNSGLGVGRTDVDTCSARPPCSHGRVFSPTSGSCRDSRIRINSFSAHTWPSSTSDWRSALRVSALVACRPATSAIATIASDTSTSISVKPEQRRSPRAATNRLAVTVALPFAKRTGVAHRWRCAAPGPAACRLARQRECLPPARQ